jgi:energy-coupling factor transporter ATP-binding protein EcfA2
MAMMFLAVVGLVQQRTVIGTDLRGLLHQLNNTRLKDILVIAGPLNEKVMKTLRVAFPPSNTFLVTTLPVDPIDDRCVSLAGINIPQQLEYTEPISVSVVGAKGGVGKSTFSLMLALYLHRTSSQDVRIVIVDADAQAGLSQLLAEGGKLNVLPITPDRRVILLSSRYGESSHVPPAIVGWYLGAKYVIVDNGNIPDRVVTAPCMVMVTSASALVHQSYISALQRLSRPIDVTVVTQDPRILLKDRQTYVRFLKSESLAPRNTITHPGTVVEFPDLYFPGEPAKLISHVGLLLEDRKVRSCLESVVAEIHKRWEQYSKQDVL